MPLALPGTAVASTVHVRAGAPPGGDGSRARPLDDLQEVERRSSRGDRIVVLPAREALDGGIALKPRQSLIGAGRSVRRTPAPAGLPRITNSDPKRHSGDAVVLADGALVRNLRITGALRGGIYGQNVRGVRVVGNDVSSHNRSCTEGFHIPPFRVPTNVPGVDVPISDGLSNGWAGIMLDADRGSGEAVIRGNRVHDAQCGDGIDVRMSGTADYRAAITRNVVEDLRQGEDFESLLAIGMQTLDRSRLRARLDRNRQTDLGNEGDPEVFFGPLGADTEGVFVNPADASRMSVTISRNTYTNPKGLGGFSGNGMEYVTMGDGSRSRVVIRDSTFSQSSGDVLEQLGLGTNADMSLTLDNVVATRSLGFAGSGFGNTVLIPGNNADCLLVGSGGAGNRLRATITDSRLTKCANNGITIGAATANGEGPTAELELDVADSEITGNRGANLRAGTVEELERMSIRVQRTDLSDSRGTGSGLANLSAEDLGSTPQAAIDLGGGPLGSVGRNCLEGGTLAADVVGYDVAARRNWWGRPAGPGPGRTVVVRGSLDTGAPLEVPPTGVC